MKPSAILEAIMLAISTFNSLRRDCLLLIHVSRLFILAFEKISSLLSIPTHKKTLTNWNIIIFDNCGNVRCDKITTTVHHTRYNMLLCIYNDVITTNICTTYYIPFLRVLYFVHTSMLTWFGSDRPGSVRLK